MNAWICAQRATDRDLETKKVNAWIRANANFLYITVTSVTSVTSVIFFADLLFSIYYKSVTPVICYSPKVFDFISDLYL